MVAHVPAPTEEGQAPTGSGRRARQRMPPAVPPIRSLSASSLRPEEQASMLRSILDYIVRWCVDNHAEGNGSGSSSLPAPGAHAEGTGNAGAATNGSRATAPRRCLPALVLQCMIVPSARNAGASTFAVKCLTSPGLTEDESHHQRSVDSQIDARDV